MLILRVDVLTEFNRVVYVTYIARYRPYTIYRSDPVDGGGKRVGSGSRGGAER